MSRRRLIGARRDRGSQYLLVTIAAFAVTVAGTRWYLDLAGYPTVGGGELHVAHALWGGLALVVAAIVPLLWVGHRSLVLSALLAGLGVGLFIDEVGKFLTTSTDYFFAPAAPIIYGGLLLLVLLWFILRRSSGDAQEATHAVLEALRDGVDGRLTAAERDRVASLRRAKGEPPQGELDAELLAVLESPAIDSRLVAAGPLASGSARRWLERLLPTRIERWLVYAGLVFSLLTALFAGLMILALALVPEAALVQQVHAGRIEYPEEPFWTVLLLGIYVVTGLTAAVALVLRIRGSGRWLDVALTAVLIDLVVGELVAFYAAQFTALASAVWGVILLGLVADLRVRERARVDAPETRT
jgi:hypothetical protein